MSPLTPPRNNRIQAWKEKIKASAKGSRKFIFQHLKHKSCEEPPNLITDKEGNILYQPLDALAEFNSQWDQVFGANALHDNPQTILRVIWPYVSHLSHQPHVPDITARDLYDQIHRRKPEAAPGLDGWRTAELQRLPWFAFVPVALLFNQIEKELTPLPQVLTIAKQMVLNKNGDPSPMQKRLITLLPALLLSYSGLRLRQLQSWQPSILPTNLCGAIKGRTMTAVHTQLRLDLDIAKRDSTPLVGLKLDKSKCFDRLIPAMAGVLMLAFGLPRGIVHFFIQMYANLRRHLALRGWISPVATTASNGVAQGCSLSLIAVNLFMSVWSIFINLIPQVTAKAFIDDAYLWAHLSHVHELKRAFDVTAVWDTLMGQLSNPKKCQLWVSDSSHKRMIAPLFPDIPIADVIDVLGVKMYISPTKSFDFDTKKGDKVIDDLKSIAALPLRVEIKKHLISSKVIPQLTYGAVMTKIPQRVLWKTQNEIVNVLWARRPHWRSRLLVLGVVAKPHRTEPQIARAYTAVVDFVRPSAIQTCRDLQSAHPWPRESLLWQLAEALRLLGFTLQPGLCVSFRGSQHMSLFDLNHRDIAKPLQYLAKQKCYSDAASSKRRDLSRCSAIFDPDLSSLLLRKSKLHLESPIPCQLLFESVQTGCNLTNDRLFRAESPKCRLRACAKENWAHLVHECPGVAYAISRPPDHEIGVNFPVFGLCTHPRSVALHRLQMSVLGEGSTSFDVTRIEHFWTDGSVQWGNYFWLATGAYAIVDARFQVVESGRVSHWELSAYTTELYALLRVIKRATCCIQVKSDCQSLVDHYLRK